MTEKSHPLSLVLSLPSTDEIRTPLNGIIGHIDLALANNLEEAFRAENLEGLKIARGGGELLISIIQDILDLSKIEAGQMDLNIDESFSLQAVTSQTKSLADTILKQRSKEHIQFITSVDTNLNDFVKGDQFRLQQVINNLVSNAAKFTSKGEIQLRIDKSTDDETMINFTVQDTGKGIPQSHMKSIFEPFRQVEVGDTREHGGTGLGLTISRRLVEMMGGKLHVESTAEGEATGSTFTFTLPYKTGITPQKIVLETIGTPRTIIDPVKRPINGKVLVAEDDKVSRRLAERILRRAGYETLLACDGQEAVDMYREKHGEVALILMDVQM